MANIPRQYKAVDGVSKPLPGSAMVPYMDWDTLRREFILNKDCPRPRTWLKQVKGWSSKKVSNGNTDEHIVHWREDRADFQAKLTQQALADVMAEERRLLPLLRKAKLTLVLAAIKSAGSWNRLEASEQRMLYQVIKTELGEPISMKVHGLITAKDPVEALLEDYGLMKDGLIIDDEPDDDEKFIGGSDIGEAAAVDSSAPIEVSQG